MRFSGFSRKPLYALLGLSLCWLHPSSPLCANAFADTSWAEILKPLVRDVIVPSASAGMKKLIEKKTKVKLAVPGSAVGSNSTDSVPPMPEEPFSAGGDSDALLSMPVEPVHAHSEAVGSSDLSQPPPSVETP